MCCKINQKVNLQNYMNPMHYNLGNPSVIQLRLRLILSEFGKNKN